MSDTFLDSDHIVQDRNYKRCDDSDSREIARNRSKVRFSVITCTHRPDYYRANVVATLADQLIDDELVEIDNRDNRVSVPAALNEGRRRARGEFLVFCHHDVRFPGNWLEGLETRLAELDEVDPIWAVVGLFGRSIDRRWVGNIVDGNISGKFGELPCLVQSLDEVCIVMRRDSPLRFDETLASMHFFGADICLQANEKGLKCYAVDAPVEHLSTGFRDAAFFEAAGGLLEKWAGRDRTPHVIHTTCGTFKLKRSIAALALLAQSWLESKAHRAMVRFGKANFPPR